jgi:hypothetical protein
MRVTEAQIAANIENTRLREAGEWFPTRWWRVLDKKGNLLIETSDPQEAKLGLICDDEGNRRPHPKGSTVQHLHEKHQFDWRDVI